MHSTNQVVVFVFILTAIVAVVLAGMSTALKPIIKNNEAIYNKKFILSSISSEFETSPKDMSDEAVDEIFTNQIEQIVVNTDGEVIESSSVEAAGYKGGKAEHIDMSKERKKTADGDLLLPMYVYKNSDGKKIYIMSVIGLGLWDEIWGNIALGDDLNTIVGVGFDHKAETPGLGAEIKDNKNFPAQFIGKKILEDNGSFRSVYVRKGGAKDPVYEVDGISGATITADGVTEMLQRGLKYYQPYLATIKG